MPINSGSSEEMSMTPSPWRARSAITVWTSAFVCTSTPCVGSSEDEQPRGVAASHFASTTFCWLPPESVLTGWS